MGSRKSSTKILSNSNTDTKALAAQNEQMMQLTREQAAQQRELFTMQMNQMKDLNQGLLSGQKKTLDAQALAARNQEITNRAAGQNAYADSLEQQSLSQRAARLQEMQSNNATNAAQKQDALAENKKFDLISEFIRRRRALGV